MDYGDILGRAWRITWNNKFLWWLGLFLSLTGGGSNFGRGANNMSNSDLPASDFGAPEFFGPAVIPIICFVFLLALAFWVLSLIGRGGLIGGVNQIETDGTSTFRASWQVGTGKLWRLLGVSIIGGLPGLILAVMAIIFAFGVIGTSGLAAVSEDPSAALAGVGGLALIALICFIPLTCIAILASLFLAILRPFADRSAVLEDEPVIASYQRGWQVFRDNLGDSIVLGIISFALSAIVGIIIAIPIFGIAVGIGIGFAASGGGAAQFAPVLIGGLCLLLTFILIALAVNAVVKTYFSSMWTLAYREFTVDQLPADAPVAA